MTFVLFLHIAAALFIIGPLTAASSLSPRYITEGATGLPVLRLLNQVTRIFGLASLLVFAFGVALVRGDIKFGQFWISSSMTLFIVALGLLFALVERDQRRAIQRLEAGTTAPVRAGRINGVAAAVAVIWTVILLLMVYKPGGPKS